MLLLISCVFLAATDYNAEQILNQCLRDGGELSTKYYSIDQVFQLVFDDTELALKVSIDSLGNLILDSLDVRIIAADSLQVEDETLLNHLTASRLIASDANKKLVSSDMNNWASGTANQIAVTDNGDGTITIGYTATPVLPDGTTATTQSNADGSTKVATTNYVDTAISSFSTDEIHDDDNDTYVKTENTTDSDSLIFGAPSGYYFANNDKYIYFLDNAGTTYIAGWKVNPSGNLEAGTNVELGPRYWGADPGIVLANYMTVGSNSDTHGFIFGQIDGVNLLYGTADGDGSGGIENEILYTTNDLQMGVTTPDDVQPELTIKGDADSDAGGDTTDTFSLTLTPNATPTSATWDFTSTQSAGYTFDKNVTVAELTVTDTINTVGGATKYTTNVSLDDTIDMDLSSVLGGMQGKGQIIGNSGATYANFYFSSAGAVTLIDNTADVTTTNGTDDKLNIYDAGTGIAIENQLGSTLKFVIEILAATP